MKVKCALLEDVRDNRPLVLHFTNLVTINDCANVTICAGGSPIMCNSSGEIGELAKDASSVVLNIGTVDRKSLDMMVVAGLEANDRGIPIVLDPVGVGASKFRKDAVDKILNKVEVNLIKGNGSEISFMAGSKTESKGVDSLADTDASLAKKLSMDTGSMVCMTGRIDYISDGKKTVGLCNGTEYMERVSGTGCMLSSVAACFLGACGSKRSSVIGAVSAFNIAGEIASEGCNGPGSFKTMLFDELDKLTDTRIASRIRIE